MAGALPQLRIIPSFGVLGAVAVAVVVLLYDDFAFDPDWAYTCTHTSRLSLNLLVRQGLFILATVAFGQ